ncbi:MAG: phosphatase PAP2 family protein [Roseimicrobium sp.]
MALWYAAPLVFFLTGSVLIDWSGADLALQRAAFVPGEGWAYGEGWFWKMLYHVGTFPALFAVLVGLAALWSPLAKFLPQREWSGAVYMLLVVALGAGLVANATLKDHWGRPRPRDLAEFGGEFRYEPPLKWDPSSTGKSFPCGHATMGFFFFAHFFMNGGRRRRAWAWFALAVSLGLLIGLARALQGAHFLTDTWWAAAVMWLTSAWLWDMLNAVKTRRLDEALLARWQRGPRWMGAGVGLLGLGLCAAVALATPWQQKMEAQLPLPANGGPYELSATFVSGHVTVQNGPAFRVSGEGYGHGTPGGGIRFSTKSWQDKAWETRVKQTRKGLLTECNQQLTVQAPLNRLVEASVQLDGTRLDLALAPTNAGQSWTITGDEGTLTVHVPEHVAVSVANRSSAVVHDETGWFTAQKDTLRAGPPEAPVAVKLKLTLKRGLVRLVRAAPLPR